MTTDGGLIGATILNLDDGGMGAGLGGGDLGGARVAVLVGVEALEGGDAGEDDPVFGGKGGKVSYVICIYYCYMWRDDELIRRPLLPVLNVAEECPRWCLQSPVVEIPGRADDVGVAASALDAAAPNRSLFFFFFCPEAAKGK